LLQDEPIQSDHVACNEQLKPRESGKARRLKKEFTDSGKLDSGFAAFASREDSNIEIGG